MEILIVDNMIEWQEFYPNESRELSFVSVDSLYGAIDYLEQNEGEVLGIVSSSLSCCGRFEVCKLVEYVQNKYPELPIAFWSLTPEMLAFEVMSHVSNPFIVKKPILDNGTYLKQRLIEIEKYFHKYSEFKK